MAIVYLGVGSNLGNRQENIQKALKLLQEYRIEIVQTSTLIETEPVGGPPQGKFLNGALKAKTDLSPLELLKTLKSIEKTLGRVKTSVNDPRPIDLDILLYDNVELNTAELVIPHPKMLTRDFVLTPLKEIEPTLIKELLHARR